MTVRPHLDKREAHVVVVDVVGPWGRVVPLRGAFTEERHVVSPVLVQVLNPGVIVEVVGEVDEREAASPGTMSFVRLYLWPLGTW